MTTAKTFFSRLKGNLGWLLINHCISQLIAFAGTIYLARILGAASFGQYALALVVGQCLWIFGDCGISVYGVAAIASKKEDLHRIIPLLTTIKALTSVLVFILYVITLLLLPLEPALFWVLLGGGFFVLTNSLNGEWIFRGIERIEFIAICNFIVSTLFIFSIIFFVKTSKDAVAAIFLRSFSFLPGSIIFIYFVGKVLHVKRFFSLASISGKIFREATSYMLAGGMSMVYVNILVLLLGIFQSSAELGVFHCAYRPTLLIIFFGGIVPMAFFPILSDSYHNRPHHFKNIHSLLQIIMLALGFPIAVGGSLLSKDIIALLYGAQYFDAFPIFQLLICIVPITFLRMTYGYTLLACGFQKIHFFSTTSATVSIGLIAVYLVRQYGIFGAAMSFCFGEIIFLFILLLCFSKCFSTGMPTMKIIFKIVLANSFMGIIVYGFRDHFFISVIGGLLIYCLALWWSGVISYILEKIRQVSN